MGKNLILYRVECCIEHKLHISILFVFLFLISIISASAAPIVAPIHDMDGNQADPECRICHLVSSGGVYQSELSAQDSLSLETGEQPMKISAISSGLQSAPLQNNTDYTSILTIGQTPYQLGAFFSDTTIDTYTGWSWWDTDGNGNEKQKNLISLVVLDNTSGLPQPVTGLVSLPTWPQASYRNHTGTYSYKADTEPTPITTQSNHADQMNLWMIKAVDLTGSTTANLTFWTWYSIETDWDYGYIAISIDDGISWTNLPGTLTTNTNPWGNNIGNGITGSSGGWVQETMNLAPYTGNRVLLGFIFRSDAAYSEEGWYVDDVNVISNTETIFSDDAETLQTIRTLSVNVSYPSLTLINLTDPITNATTLQYNQQTRQVNLYEDMAHPGTYLGYFVYDPFGEQYSGNYTVVLDTSISNTTITSTEQFQTTIFGCQNCHNKNEFGTETNLVHPEYGGMESCMSICHTGTRGIPFFGMTLNLNPMHVHEMQYGHSGGFLSGISYSQPPYNVSAHVGTTECVQCHTSFVHDNTGTDIATIANYTMYGMNISFPAGTHKNLTCEFCHGTLDYPVIPQGQYQLHGSLGNYTPVSTSHESFTDTYIIASNGTENLNVTVTSDYPTTKSVALTIVGPVDNTTTAALQTSNWKAENLVSPISLNIANPDMGTWLVKVIQLQTGDPIDYNITSNYPIEEKPIIRIPECNDCHNQAAIDDAYTEFNIPDWNPGYAHTDTNDDGTYDMQCRTCHDAMHNVNTRDCNDCHSIVPNNHPVVDPAFSQYTSQECLLCHGDPHYADAPTMGPDCLSCHPDRNTSLFAGAKHSGIDGESGIVNNSDCWGCHNTDGVVNGSYLTYIDATDSGDDVYSNDNFSVCYNCHMAEQLLAVPQPDIFMRILLNTSLKIPLYNTTWGTNFYGDSWWKGDTDSNLHQFHLVELRAMGGLPSTGAYCAKCHQPHGTAGPALLVDNLNFSYLYQNGSIISSRDEWDLNYGAIISGFNGAEYQYCEPCHGSDNRYMRVPVV